jgi:hypothetical protein
MCSRGRFLDKIQQIAIVIRMKGDIESRFQILITISLFFPVLLANLATIAGKPAEIASLLLLQTSVVVGFYLLDYLIFQHRKDELSDRSLLWINRVLLIALGIFIVPILGIATVSLDPPPWIASPAVWLSGTSVLFVLAGPPAIELLLILSAHRDRPAHHGE